MRMQLGLLLVSCGAVLAGHDSGETTSTSPQQCTTETSGSVTGVKYILLVTALSPDIRNWEIKVTKKPPSECEHVAGLEALVCDNDGIPKVQLNDSQIIVHRVGNIMESGDLEYSVYCEPKKTVKTTEVPPK